jgi:hypothetical protein
LTSNRCIKNKKNTINIIASNKDASNRGLPANKPTKALEISRAMAMRNTIIEIGSLLVCMDRSYP